MAVTTGAGCSLIIGHLGVWSAGIRLIIVVRIRLRRPRSLAGKGYFAECGKDFEVSQNRKTTTLLFGK